jgi:hypothetical protein
LHPLDLAAVALPALRVLRLFASIARVGAVARRGAAEHDQRLAASALTDAE